MLEYFDISTTPALLGCGKGKLDTEPRSATNSIYVVMKKIKKLPNPLNDLYVATIVG